MNEYKIILIDSHNMGLFNCCFAKSEYDYEDKDNGDNNYMEEIDEQMNMIRMYATLKMESMLKEKNNGKTYQVIYTKR